jgi:hypothetical protein
MDKSSGHLRKIIMRFPKSFVGTIHELSLQMISEMSSVETAIYRVSPTVKMGVMQQQNIISSKSADASAQQKYSPLVSSTRKRKLQTQQSPLS